MVFGFEEAKEKVVEGDGAEAKEEETTMVSEPQPEESAGAENCRFVNERLMSKSELALEAEGDRGKRDVSMR